MSNIKTHKGSCHCGHVKFEVDLDATKGSMCNCTICTKLGLRGAQTKPEALRALTDESTLGCYEWGTVGKRYFCKVCGTHCYSRGYLEEIGGAFASINLNALDDIDPYQVHLVHWDGRHDNWQAGPGEKPYPITLSA